MVAELKRLVWCDVCAAEANPAFPQSPAVWESPIRLGDAPAVQVDLCEVHRMEYVDALANLLEEFGRTPDAQLAQRPRRGRPPGSKPKPPPEMAAEPCPVCGLEYSRKNLARHLRDVHQTEKPGAHVCPECQRMFERANSLGVHRRFAHGVVGASVAAVAARKKTGAPMSTRNPQAVHKSSTAGTGDGH